MSDFLVVLAKQPLRGLAKTRLARDVGLDRAQRLAEAFVIDTLELARSRSGARTLVAHAPADAGPWFELRAPWAARRPQSEGDLGQRLRSATRAAFEGGATRCVVIGTDTPHLPPETLDEAFLALDSADLCLGPSLDGGYYLIGLRADRPRLFENVPWSSGAVLQVTLARAVEQGLRVHRLREDFDVDEGADLERLAQGLLRRPGTAPATRAVLFGPEPGPGDLAADRR